MIIHLPISKSIANRLLICKAKRGDDIEDVVSSADYQTYPDDVQRVARILAEYGRKPRTRHLFDVDNCGTAMRFLCAYFASEEGSDVVLDGCQRMRQRPIGQLIDALRKLGAEIDYVGEEGYPPLRIRGARLKGDSVVLNKPQSTQFVSALLLVGAHVETDSESPYVKMTRSVMEQFESGVLTEIDQVERDWSSAAFWLERQALGLVDDVAFPGLKEQTLQGDSVAAELFDKISKGTLHEWDFSSCPDLYPAAAVACYKKGLEVKMTGLESLRLKESDRVAAVEENLRRIKEEDPSKSVVLQSYGDHRIAMALMAAGYAVDDEECVRKSYPDFVLQLRGVERVVARRGVNDDNKGKKWALKKLIGRSEATYIWLADDDVVFPKVCPSPEQLENMDMLILPLRMDSSDGQYSWLVRMQILEYAAIQGLTMRMAERGQAVMCSGANMLVRRKSWQECSSALHMEIPSGDDMFMLEEMKRRGLRVKSIDDERLEAVCYAEKDIKTLMRQRMRWAGKAPHYQDRDILLCGAKTVLSNWLAVVCPIWLLAKWVVDTRLILSRRSQDVRCMYRSCAAARLWLDTLVLTIIYPWYMLISLVGGLWR